QSQNSLSNATFILYNAAGQQVKQLNNISGNSFTLHRENLATGLYYYQLLQDNAMLAADKLIISEK
ncbi:MAG: T9SS type A sorting domain-containing protein, partial [Bacteroidia bacterium]